MTPDLRYGHTQQGNHHLLILAKATTDLEIISTTGFTQPSKDSTHKPTYVITPTPISDETGCTGESQALLIQTLIQLNWTRRHA
jgi:hypothetical protein